MSRKHVTWTQYYCCWVSILPTRLGGHPRLGGVTAVLVEIQVLCGDTLCRLTFRRSVVIPSSEWNGHVRMYFFETSVTIWQSARRPSKCAVTAVFWVTRFLFFSIPFAVYVFTFSFVIEYDWVDLHMPGLRSSGNGKGRTAPKKTAVDRRDRFWVGRRFSLPVIF
jgi:hypothetical protein